MKIKPIYIILALFIIAILYDQVRSAMLGDLLVPTKEGWLDESYPIDIFISKVASILSGALLTVLLVFILIRFTIKLLVNAVK